MVIKGRITFTLDGHTIDLADRELDALGASDLPWAPLDPLRHLGKEVTVKIEIPAQPQPFQISCQALLNRERTPTSETMGINFLFPADMRQKLEKLIQTKGYQPKEYSRKYPRIPAQERIQTFPLRAIGVPIFDEIDAAPADGPLVFDVGNLSPNGVLLSTESQLASSLLPGHRMNLTLEPRGWFPHKIQMEALICRVKEEVVPTSGNLRRSFGIRFTQVGPTQQQAFLELLKDILERIKK
jgi:hypothetical protein